MSSAADAAASPSNPSSGVFGQGLLNAVLAKSIPSVMDDTVPLPVLVAAAPNGEVSASAAPIPALDMEVEPAAAVTSGPATSRRVTRSNTEVTLPSGDAVATPPKPKRPRGAAATAALASAQLSTQTKEQLEAVHSALQLVTTRVNDMQARLDANSHDAHVQLGEVHDAIDSVNSTKTEHKELRVAVFQDLPTILGGLHSAIDAITPRLTELEAFRISALPRLAKLAELHDAFPDLTSRIATLEKKSNEDEPAAKRLRLADAVFSFAPKPASAPVTLGNTTVSAIAPTAPIVAPPAAPYVFQQSAPPVAPVLPATPAPLFTPPTTQLQTVSATQPSNMGTSSVASTSPFLPATVATRAGLRRNFYFRIGPVNANGARPLDVITSLLKLLPNHSLFTALVKDAQLDPADFSYIIGTVWNFQHAAGIVNAWSSTRPASHASINAEIAQGN